MTNPSASWTPRGLVVHLPAADRIEAVLRNVVNLAAELTAEPAGTEDGAAGTPTPVTGDALIEVVAHGPGLDAVLRGSAHEGRVRELLDAGVEFDACANTMSARGVEPGALIPGVIVVPSGVAHLARRQWQGYAYLRP